MKNTVEKQKRKLSQKQLALIFIPFISTLCYLGYLLFTKRFYAKNCLVSFLKAIMFSFATGIAFAIIGLLSYTVTLIISLVIMGIIFNLAFFKSYINMTK